MTKGNGTMERLTWMAAVAVLATSLCWLAAINAVMLARTLSAHSPAALVVARALAKGVLALFTHGWPMILAAGLTAVLLWTLLQGPRGNGALGEGVRHARA